MTRTIILFCLLLCTLFEPSQAQNDWIKLDVPRLFFKDIHVSYEHVFSPKMSGAISVNAQLPINLTQGLSGSFLDDFNQNWNVGYFTGGRLSGFDITPEARLYFLKKAWKREQGDGAPKGFYGFAFLRFSQIQWELPYHWIDDENFVEVDVETDGKFAGGGLGGGLGYQWIFNNRISLDVQFLGLGYGRLWGNAVFDIVDSEELPQEIKEQVTQHMVQDLRYSIDNEAPLKGLYSIDLEANGDQIDAKGGIPWLMLKFGIAVGIAL